MPQQETFFEERLAGLTVEVLKTYDRNLAHEAYGNMNDEAQAHLWASLGIEQEYEAADIPSAQNDREEFLWEELLEAAREKYRHADSDQCY